MIQEHLNGDSTSVERTVFQQDSSPIRLRSLKPSHQLSPSYKSPKSQTPSKTKLSQSPPPSSNSKRMMRANHARCQAFEKSPDLRMQKVSHGKENQEMDISPHNNETILSPPKLVLSKSNSGLRKPLSPISPQMMEDSPLENVKRKTPNRYSPYLLKSVLKNANSPRNVSPLVRNSATFKRKSPHNRSTPNNYSKHSNDPNRMSESPDADCIQLETPPHILQQEDNKKFIGEQSTIRVKPIQFQAPTSSANEPFSPIAQTNHIPQQATSSTFRSPFKTPSYIKKRQALAEDLGMAFEDSYSRSAKKNATTQNPLKNPFTPNSFKQIKVIPDKAFRMMVGNTAQQQVVEEPKKKKSIIRSMRDYRKNKKESLKSKLRGDSPPKDYSSSTDSLKKSRSPARKRKFDETEEEIQGGATVLSNLGVLIDQSTVTSSAPVANTNQNDFMIAADIEIESDGEDVVIEELEHAACESPTKKIKSEQGRPLWSRLKKALTKKKSNPEEDDEESKQPKNTLRRKLSKKGLQAFRSNQVQQVQNNLSNPNLLSTQDFNNEGPLRKQRSFGENYFSSMVHGRKQQQQQMEEQPADLHNISFDETDLNKHKNRQFQLQDDLQEQFLNNMKMVKHTDSNLKSSFTNNTTIAATTNECVKNFKIPSLNLKNVPTLQLAPKEEKPTFTYSFVEIINTPHHREYFTKHCINEYNSENIEFWCAVRLEYSYLRDRSQRYQMAIKLLNEYVDLSSDKALNIDKKSILQVKTRINDETDDLSDLFDSITNHVETVMMDSFKRFQLLPIYQEMIAHHKTIISENNKTDLDTPRGANFKNKMFSFLSPKGLIKQQHD